MTSLLIPMQAADRRDRLIYVLSQINAARGDDAMQVDEDESSEESEEEVSIHASRTAPMSTLPRLKNSTRRAPWSSSRRAGG